MPAEIKKLLNRASVSLLLDSYDAIFSDFDPRPYHDRTISDDFIYQARKVLRGTEGGASELHFLIPKKHRKERSEIIIKERLHKHFRKVLAQLEGETQSLVRRGILLILLGMSFMLLVSFITHYYEQQYFWVDFIKVLLEPAGWFMAWYGFDQIFYYSKLKSHKLNFYRKMVKAELKFDVY